MGMASGAFWIACLSLPMILPTDGAMGTFRELVLKAEGNRYLQLLLVQHACIFAVGVALFAVSRQGLNRKRLLSIGLLPCACVLELIGQNGIIARLTHLDLSPVPAIIARLATMGVLCIAIRTNQAVSFAVGRPGLSAARFAGRITYPLYLSHDPICFSLAVLLAPIFGRTALAAAICGAVIVAGLIVKCLERPLRDMLSRLI
jgi:peptidoglycan/LPS O-acetylase OafA/YrhL